MKTLPKTSPALLILLPFLLLAPAVGAQTRILRWRDPNVSGLEPPNEFFPTLSDLDGDGFPEIVVPDRTGQPDTVLWIYSLAKQQVLFTIPTSAHTGTLRPGTLVVPGDLDGDGFRDLVLAFPKDFPNPPVVRNLYRAFSGRDGSILWEVDSKVAFPGFIAVFLYGDQDGDGVEDVAARLPSSDTLFVLSGVDGSVLQTFVSPTGGFSDIIPAGDIDSDGVPDLVNVTFGFQFFSGRTGQFLFTQPCGTGDGHTRYSVAGVGDVDGDGRDDWVEGWRGDLGGVPCQPSTLVVYTGVPPREIARIPGRVVTDLLWTGPYFHLDFDKDGVQDILFTGSNFDGATPCRFRGGPPPFYVQIYSVVRNQALVNWPLSQQSSGFQSLDADWDGDGMLDMLEREAVGHPFQEALSVFSIRRHLTVSSRQFSQSQGGTLTFTIDAGARYSGRTAFLLPADGKIWPFFFKRYQTPSGQKESIAVPFRLTHLSRRAWKVRKKTPSNPLVTTLDAQGQGTISLTFAPGSLSSGFVGRTIRFSAVLDSSVPGFPEIATEAVEVQFQP